jgi:hypothetical protein
VTLTLRRQRERADGEGLRYMRVEVLRGKMPGAAEAEVVLGPTAGLEPVHGIHQVSYFACDADNFTRYFIFLVMVKIKEIRQIGRAWITTGKKLCQKNMSGAC